MKLYSRENYLKKIRGFYNADDIIKVITGVRRCGKSSLMATIADEIRQSGVPEENLIYIDLDLRPNKGIKTADQLEALILKKGNTQGRKYLFVDEIQNVTGFEAVINGFRTEGDWSIFITGSNSYLLSGELVTKLTGRYIEFEMFPLSFEEYEEMKQFYGKEINTNPLLELNAYITEGGFPRAMFFDTLADKRRYVMGVIDEIFEKDIRKRVKIRSRETFETVMRFVVNNFGAAASLRNLCNALNKAGTAVTLNTVARYVKALVDAKILYECPRFDLKSKRSLQGEKKYYISDLSFYFAENIDNRINFGPVLENIVFVYARSRDYSVSVGRIGKFECDFILRDTKLSYSYVQVAYTISNRETEDREYRALESIKDNYPKYVMTTDYLLQKRSGIAHVNLIDFMRSGQLF
ncbi:MAG: ATP-binding protein [Clostridia bacterium]|nr:ATP-binding protein [Clostridia bacterium]MBQ3868899.1 ATP-binding protein [Clostridia bacterium]